MKPFEKHNKKTSAILSLEISVFNIHKIQQEFEAAKLRLIS